MKSPKLYIVFLFALSNLLSAQVDQKMSNNLNDIYNATSRLLKIEYFNQSGLKSYQFIVSDYSKKLPDYRLKDIELQQKKLRNDIGLSLKLAINHNLSDTFEEENNEFVTTRYRTELEWQILKNGWLSNKQQAKQLNAEALMLAMEQQQEAIILWRRQFRLSYTYAINRELLDLYDTRLNFLDQYFDILTKLYADKLIDRERIIKISYDIEITKQEIINYHILNDRIKDSILPEFNNAKVPFVTIADNNFQPIVFKKQKDSIALLATAMDNTWFQDISLSVYTNQNRINSTITNRNYTSVGLRLKIPLKRSFRKARKKNNINMLLQQQSDKSIGKYNQTLTNYNAYREKLKDLNEQYKIWCLVEERKRKLQLIKNEVNDMHTGINLADTLLEQFEILKNMLQIKRQLYTSLSHLYQLDTNLQLSLYSFKEQNNTKVLISHSSSFTKMQQIAFLQLKQIQTICIEDIDEEFKQKLIKEGFKIISIEDNKELIKLESWMLSEQNKIKIL